MRVWLCVCSVLAMMPNEQRASEECAPINACMCKGSLLARITFSSFSLSLPPRDSFIRTPRSLFTSKWPWIYSNISMPKEEDREKAEGRGESETV